MSKSKLLQAMVIFITIFFLWTSADAQAPVQILVVPFTVHSDQDLAFAQSAVRDMCTSRLTVPGKILPIQKNLVDNALAEVAGQITLETAYAMGDKLKADYVLWGSLTVLDKRISTDAGLALVKTKEKVLSFSKSGFGTDEIISHVDLLSNEVLRVVLGSSSEEMQSKDSAGAGSSTVGSSPQPTLIPWKSNDFDTRIVSIAIGDVDGEGNNEIVMAGKNTIYVYRLTAGGEFHKIVEMKEEGYRGILGVDVGDINQNGVAEIFVTRVLDHANRLASFVLEWNNGEFTRTVTGENWFYRVIPRSGDRKEPILLGQEKSNISGVFGDNKVYEMQWEGGSYTSRSHVVLPKKVNVCGMTKGSFENDGSEKTVGFSNTDHLWVADVKGNIEWKSGEQYGGSNVFIDYPSPDGDRSITKRMYLPHRIHVADLDGNGKNEIIVVKNEDVLGRFLSKQRSLEKGQIFGLEWDHDSFRQIWQSPVYMDYISDYTVGDADNDGQLELLFSVVVEGGIFESLRSYIIVRSVGK